MAAKKREHGAEETSGCHAADDQEILRRTEFLVESKNRPMAD
jgi:hypothetical protein